MHGCAFATTANLAVRTEPSQSTEATFPPLWTTNLRRAAQQARPGESVECAEQPHLTTSALEQHVLLPLESKPRTLQHKQEAARVVRFDSSF